jgi:hypothetical protein
MPVEPLKGPLWVCNSNFKICIKVKIWFIGGCFHFMVDGWFNILLSLDKPYDILFARPKSMQKVVDTYGFKLPLMSSHIRVRGWSFRFKEILTSCQYLQGFV